MKPYEYLEHTADAKFKAYGNDLAEAFKNSAYATFNILTDTKKIKGKTEKELIVRAKKKTTLLYDFLDELLFLLDSEGFLLHEITDLEIRENDGMFHLECTFNGDIFSNKYEVSGNIKSVTYNEMEIDEKKDNVMVQVVVDI